MRWFPLIALLLCACGAKVVPVGEPPRGQVLCIDDRHWAFIRTDALASSEGHAILAHEQHHLMQARLIGGCKEWNDFLAKPEQRARAEAAAFCVSAVVIATEGLVPTMQAAVDHYAKQLSGAYLDLKLTEEAAREMITGFCT